MQYKDNSSISVLTLALSIVVVTLIYVLPTVSQGEIGLGWDQLGFPVR